MTPAAPRRPTVLLLGASGQLGQALLDSQRTLAPDGVELVAAGREQIDLLRPRTIEALIERLRPVLVINAAAYTAVDRAEAEPALAQAINADAPAAIARQTARIGAALIHYSTDYVFDGGQAQPYLETDPAHPLSQYGRSKLAGEQAVAAANPRHLILRTSWLHSRWGGNFLKTILRRLLAGQPLKVVDDQVGTPTSATDVARASIELARRIAADVAAVDAQAAWGTYHASAQGRCSWYDYARAIADDAQARGWLEPGRAAIAAVATRDYPQAARRPAHAVLDSGKLQAGFGLALPRWQDGVAATIGQLREDPAFLRSP